MKPTTTSTILASDTKRILSAYTPENSAEPSYKLTHRFMFLFMLVSMGRLQDIIPVLRYVPLAAISTVLTLLAYKSESRNSGDSGFMTTSEERLVAGLFLAAMISVPGSYWIKMSVDTLIKNYFPSVVMFSIIAITVRKLEDILKIFWFFLIVMMMINFMSLKSGISHNSVGSDLYDANDLALVLNCFLPFSVYFIAEFSGKKKLLLVFISLVIVATVVLTGSRGGFLGLTVFGLYWIATSRRKVLALTIVGIALFLVPVVTPSDTWDRISTMWNPKTDYDRTAGDRTYVWERGMKTFAKHPLLGVGIGCYAISDGQSKEEGKWMTAHNSFIQLGVEFGVVGLFLYLSLLVGTIIRMARLRVRLSADEEPQELLGPVKAVEASLIIYAVVGFFLSQAYLHQLYLVLGLAVAVQKIARANPVEDNEVQSIPA